MTAPAKTSSGRLPPDESIAADVMTPLIIITGSLSAVAFGLLLIAQWSSDLWAYLFAGSLAVASWWAGLLNGKRKLQAAGQVLCYTYTLLPIATILSFGIGGNVMIFLAPLGVVMGAVLISPEAPLNLSRVGLLFFLGLMFVVVFSGAEDAPDLATALALIVTLSVLLFGTAVIGWVAANSIRGTIGWALDAGNKADRREKLLRETQTELEMALRERDQLNDRLYKLNRELDRARADAEAAYRSKASFMATMSHELRTPLNIIIGFSTAMIDHPEMYEDAPIPDPVKADIAEIQRSGKHLLGLINDILDLAKVEAGALELNRTTLQLGSLLDEMLSTGRVLLGDRGVVLRRDYQNPLPTVFADEVRVRQVLLNLVSNAAKFTQQGSITLGARITDDDVMLWVRDTGIGIADVDQERVFNRFEQAEQADTRQFGGTGLGLSICKWLIELHGGQMWLESAVGVGSTFYFTLPRQASVQRQLLPPESVAA